MNTCELIRRALLQGGRRPTMAGQSGLSRRRGEGYEFVELRSYVSGDDPRRIDWAATARAGSLQSRVMLEEHALVLAAILDDGASMALGRVRPRIDEAYEAITLWYSAAKMGDRSVRIGSTEVVAPREARGLAAVRICSERRSSTSEKGEEFELESALRNAHATLPLGSALLVVSDMHARIDGETLFLLAARHDVTFLLARDPWHDGFPLRGFVPLRDCRTAEQAWFFITKGGARRYEAAVAAREEALRLRFAMAGWRFGLLDGNPEEDLRALFLPHGVVA
jgi:uncharacterized protein (DUF58 family)